MVAVSEKRKRPFYSGYAWAFDLIIDRPIRRQCAAIVLYSMQKVSVKRRQLHTLN